MAKRTDQSPIQTPTRTRTGIAVTVIMMSAFAAAGILYGLFRLSQPAGKKVPASTSPTGNVNATATAPVPIWLSQTEILALPIAGDTACDADCAAAWNNLVAGSTATPSTPAPDISNQDEEWGQYAMGKALVAVRTGNTTRRNEVVDILHQVVNTEQPSVGPNIDNARSLAIGRELASYVLAADIIGLPTLDPTFEATTWRPWITSLLTRQNAEGKSLATCHQVRPNNWGTHCGASRMAVALYLLRHETDAAKRAVAQTQYDNARLVFQGWLGDRQAYASFDFQGDPDAVPPTGAYSFMPDPYSPRPINPSGAVVQGKNVDGVNTDDQQRAGNFTWPPAHTQYAYGGVEGAAVMAALLHRQGDDSWNWSQRALKRFVDWMWYTDGVKPVWDTCNETNKRFILDLVDRGYESGNDYIERMSCYSEGSVSPIGRNVAWTSWTHQDLTTTTRPKYIPPQQVAP